MWKQSKIHFNIYKIAQSRLNLSKPVLSFGTIFEVCLVFGQGLILKCFIARTCTPKQALKITLLKCPQLSMHKVTDRLRNSTI